MTDKEIKKALDSADLFLRNRANSKPAPLNEYDIDELLNIANVCNEAFDYINRLEAENERLKEEVELLHSDYTYKLVKNKAKAEVRKEFADKIFEEITEAILSNDKAIQERVERHNANRYEDDLCIMCDGKITALGGIRYFIFNLLKELVGEE